MLKLIKNSKNDLETFNWLKTFKDMWRTGVELETELKDMNDGIAVCSQPYCISIMCPDKNNCANFPYGCHSCSHKNFSCNECVHKTTGKASQYDRINNALRPSGYETIFGVNGICSIVDDHSLKRGIEVTTVGLNTNDVEVQFEVFNKICKTLLNENAFIDYTCSTHYHLLHAVPKKSKESLNYSFVLTNKYPQNFIRNVVNIFAYFSPAILYLASGGNKENAITRYNCFRKIAYIPSTNSCSLKLPDYIATYSHKLSNGGKYGLINIHHTTVTQNNYFPHFEVRANDGILSPSILTLFGIIYNALIYKALKLSYDGLYDNELEINKRIGISNQIMNIGDGCRESYNNLSIKDIQDIKDICNEMMNFIDNELKYICSFNVSLIKEKLNQLIETPIFYLRIKNKDWVEIEEIFSLKKEFENNYIAKAIVNLWPMKGDLSLSQFIDYAVDKIGCSHKSKNCKNQCPLTYKLTKAFIFNNLDMVKSYARSYML